MSPHVAATAPFPANVHAFTTLRHGAGGSKAPFDTFNLGNFRDASGDDPAVVARNRAELVERFGLPSAPHWLKQVHGTRVVRFDAPALPALPQTGEDEPEADAAVTSTPGVVLAILTADCLPVVFAAKDGSEIAAAHAGWPGLSKGILEAALAAMRTSAADVVAWIGPAAGPSRYEVGRDVFDAFVSRDAGAAACFVPTREGHWLADLPALARRRLAAAGMALADIHGGDLCTMSDPARFFSHRRDGRSGRIATLAWMA
ncbi:peptidoglycan editing factor PgeF [Hydrogenophaga borbori]|uniref:peptidoglycan editing factor PgeF n=1 Tax=Hydrogenophaga borbori TaxID=2294117 RepID=UPI00301CE4E0